MNMLNYVNFEDFGYRELRTASELLEAYLNQKDCVGSDSSVLDDGNIMIGFNSCSGYVFLTDDLSYRTFILNGDGELVEFITLDNIGGEGTVEDILEEYKLDELPIEDLEIIKNSTTLETLIEDIDMIIGA